MKKIILPVISTSLSDPSEGPADEEVGGWWRGSESNGGGIVLAGGGCCCNKCDEIKGPAGW